MWPHVFCAVGVVDGLRSCSAGETRRASIVVGENVDAEALVAELLAARD